MSQQNQEEINYLDLIKNYKSKKNQEILESLEERSKGRMRSSKHSQDSNRLTEDRRSAASKGRNSSRGANPQTRRSSGSRGGNKGLFGSSENRFSFSKPIGDSSILEQVARDRKNFEKSSLMNNSKEVENLNRKKEENFHSKFQKNIRKTAREFEFEDEKTAKLCFNFTLGLFLFGFALLSLCFLSTYLRQPAVNYCDNNDYRTKDCTPCPPIAVCKNGVIKKCIHHTHVLQDGKCVFSKKEYSREMTIANQLVKILARRRGDSKCYGGSYTMTKAEVEKFFQSKFSEKGWSFRDTFRWMNIMSGNEFSAMGLKVEQKPNFIIYSEIGQPSFNCSLMLFYANNKALVILLSLVLVFLSYILIRLKMKMRVFDRSREAFEDAIHILQECGNKELPRVRLVQRLQDRGFLDADYNEVMEYFDLIRENDERMGIGMMTFNGIKDYYYFLY